jgi:WhiB family redox-sensing transcriptional regulator
MSGGRWHEVKPCGTPAAYRRHIRRKEPIDLACRLAHNAKRNQQRRNATERAWKAAA